MKQTSTLQLLTLHAYSETSEPQKEFLSREFIKDPALYEEFMEIVRTKKALNGKLMSPSESSMRIILEHSSKTEHLQES